VPRTYDPEFRRRVVELVRASRPVRVVAAELGLAEATVYRWKAQDLIDRGMRPGTSTSEHGELAAAKRRIKELETELALVTQAAKLFEEGVRPKATYPVIAELASQGIGDQRGGLVAVDRPAHHPTREHIQHHTAVHLALPGWDAR
jgi:transposase-like protein